MIALTACQSYEARPLAPDVHRAAWHGRTLDGFVDRLEPTQDDPSSAFDAADGLTLREAELVALVYNPGLRLARLRADRARASAGYAGRWADPSFSASVLRVVEDIPDRWVVNPTLTVTIPLSGRLDAEQDRADAAQQAETDRVLEEQWRVRREVRQAWARWAAARLRLEETERFVAAMEPLVRTAEQLATAGEMPSTEAKLFVLERAGRANDLLRLRGDVAAAEQRLRSWIGLAPDAPVELVPSFDVDATAPGDPAAGDATAGDAAAGDAAAGDAAAGDAALDADRNPTLVRLRAEYAVAEEALRREVLRQYPDLTVGPSYEVDQGQSRIGFFGGFPLPLWNANRRAIAEARVERDLARAAFETEYELLVGRRAVAHADTRALARQRDELERTLVPLVEGQLQDALRLLRLGESSSLVLLASLARAYDTKLDLIDTRMAEAVARAELRFVLGPRIPATKENDL